MSSAVDYDLSRAQVEQLLAEFLTGALGLELQGRLTELSDLPLHLRGQVRTAEAAGRTWCAWMSTHGPVAAWGAYEKEHSKHLNAFLMLIDWVTAGGEHHSQCCYCNPRRTTEWTIGRGRP